MAEPISLSDDDDVQVLDLSWLAAKENKNILQQQNGSTAGASAQQAAGPSSAPQTVLNGSAAPMPAGQLAAAAAALIAAKGKAPARPAAAAPRAAAGAPGTLGDADDVEVVSARNVALADYPHPRPLCVNLPFGSTPHDATCANCFCYVCDAPAPCDRWGDGSEEQDHCHAHADEDAWDEQRRTAQAARAPQGAPEGCGGASGSAAPGAPAGAQQPSVVTAAAGGLPARDTKAGLRFPPLVPAGQPQAGGPGGGGQPGQPGQPEGGPEGQAEQEEDDWPAGGLGGEDDAAGASPDEEAELLGVLEGLNVHAQQSEAEPPPGSLRVGLHPYQKQALGWMMARERASTGVRGGILADEQGLGKTVQMLALIVSMVPSVKDAQMALKHAQREQNNMEMHVLGPAAKAARAAANGGATGSRGDGSDAGASGSDAAAPDTAQRAKRGQKRKGPQLWQPCGAGDDCTCAVCNKAREQQARLNKKEAERLAKEEQEARDRARQEKRIKREMAAAAAGREGGAASTRAAPGVGATPAPLAMPVSSLPALSGPTVKSPDGGLVKRTLIVCPLCVAQQWIDEMRDKTPQLRVALYHGSNRAAKLPPVLMASHDVVVTTYDVVKSEWAQTPSGPLFRVRWHRCVLDEAHVIRNKRTVASQAVCALQAANRWCLSGTPIVNAAVDVFALFCYLRYRPFCDIRVFNARIAHRIKKARGVRGPNPNERSRREGFRELRVAMQAVTMRRLKSTRINGQPIIVLPPRTLSVVEHEFSPAERAFYDALEAQVQLDFNAYVREGWTTHYAHILVLLLRLRQACIHPFLAQVKGDARQAAAAAAAAAGEGGGAGAGGRGLDGAAKAALLAKLRAPDAGECVICMDVPQAPVMTRCAHGPMCRECMESHLEHQDNQNSNGTCPLCRSDLTPADLFSEQDLAPPAPAPPPPKAGEEPEAAPPYVGSTKLDAVVEQLRATQEEDDAFNAALAPGAAPQVTKTVVFSQFTKALDLLQTPLRGAGMDFERLDGRMSMRERTAAVREFVHNPKVRVLLASTKAAGAGLNLAVACRVILLDVWWNAACEDQAIDRCHRLGQTREVKVTKLIVSFKEEDKETVEQRIMAMQEDKRDIAKAALGDGRAPAAGASRLTLRDLRRLFGTLRSVTEAGMLGSP